MKRLIGILILSLFLLPYVFSAGYNPLPIVGKVKGMTVPVDVRITNLRTGVSVDTQTIKYGDTYEYNVEWANTYDDGGLIIKYQPGDRFKIVIPICEDSPICVREVTYTGGAIFENFDLSEIQYNECPPCICPTTTTITCPEPIICPEPVECDSCCLECPVCDKDLAPNWILWVLSFFGVTVPAGMGVKFVLRRRKGTGKLEAQLTQHKHKLTPKGREKYHSIYTIHDHLHFRHPKGLSDPWNHGGWGTERNPYKDYEG